MISFHFSISFHAALLLMALGRFVEQFPEGFDTNYSKEDSPQRIAWKELIPSHSRFIVHSKQLSRQGLISTQKDELGRTTNWNVTAKGKAMIEVLKCEVEEFRTAEKIYSKFAMITD